MNIELKRIPFTTSKVMELMPIIPKAEYERRLATLYKVAEADWVVVYGDREHYGNLTYLLNFDPRFEEVLLVLGPNNARSLVVGNEDLGYGSVLPFPVDMVLSQTLSLPGQQRDTAPKLKEVLAKLGIGLGHKVSLVGWKYLEPNETDTPEKPAFVPAFFVDTLRSLVGKAGKLTDGTALMIHPEHGLRTNNTADQIAVFEVAGLSASEAVFNVINRARPGMTEMQAIAMMAYAGQPQTMHPIFASGNAEINGLRSASNRVIEYGDGVSTALGYWGSLVCRAGMMLGEVDQTYLEKYVKPYFKAIISWYDAVKIGVTGGEIYRKVTAVFEGTGLQSSLNPSHLTSYDEWLHSPIRPGSSEQIRSGMVFQVDIIPTPLKAGQMLNCEDTICLADEPLREEIKVKYPKMWGRIQARRQLMIDQLGIHMAEEILPLSDGCGYLPPFWLLPDLVCVVS